MQIAGPTTRERSILLLDGHSLTYRAFFALPTTITSPTGTIVNAVYGFVSMMLRLIRDYSPHSLVVAFDSPWPTRRHQVFGEYKANRTALPSELLDQVPVLQAFLSGAGVPWVALEGFEADDILATLARTATEHGFPVLVVSGDRDLFQVASGVVRVLYTRRGVTKVDVVDEQRVQELVGVPASRYLEFRALVGDPSDNICGVVGVGKQTAIRIIKATPDIAQALRAREWHFLDRRTVERLEAHADVIHRNLDLIRLDRRVPVPFSVPEPLGSLDASAFATLGFHELWRRYVSPPGEPQL